MNIGITSARHRSAIALVLFAFSVGVTALPFDRSALAADEKLISQAQHLFAQETFIAICVKAQPKIENVRAALKKVQVQDMASEGAQLGGSVLGIEQNLNTLDVTDQRYEGALVVSDSYSKAMGAVIGTAVIVGTATSKKLKRNITICSVGVQNGVRKVLDDFVAQAVGRKADYETTSVLPNGETTEWRNWNTSGSTSGVLLLGVASPAGKDAPNLIHHLVAVGLQN